MNYIIDWVKKVLYIAGVIYVVILLLGKYVILKQEVLKMKNVSILNEMVKEYGVRDLFESLTEVTSISTLMQYLFQHTLQKFFLSTT